MSMIWTTDAEEALSRAPWILRPMIRRRMESAARKARRQSIDATFLHQIKAQQGLATDSAQARPTGDRADQIGMDIQFLAELLQRFCEQAHGGAARERVLPSGALRPYLHDDQAPLLCTPCRKLFLHAGAKRTVCPHEPKPSCRHCTTPCHLPAFRAQLAEIMVWNMDRNAPLTRACVEKGVEE